MSSIETTEVASAVPAKRLHAMVGRGRELELLRAALDDALVGKGRVILISGEPGIGKTRLAQEGEAEALKRNLRPLWGRCWESDGAPPYWPWMQVVEALLSTSEIAAATLAGDAETAQLFQSDFVRRGRPVMSDADDANARARAFHGTASLLRRVAEASPLLLILDDLQWADPVSLALLRFAAPMLAASRVVIIGTYRDTDLASKPHAATLLRDLQREPSVQPLPLRELTCHELTEHARALVGGGLSEALGTALHTQSGGNPFYLEEIVGSLRADGLLEASDDALRRPLPAALQDVLTARINRLSPACQGLLNAAALIGPEFSLGVLARVADRDAATQPLALLDEALRARLLREVPGALGGYAFVHALIGDALRRQLSPRARAELHHRIATALESLYGTRTELHLAELAHHFTEAAVSGVDADKAVAYAQRAGEQHFARLAFESAAAQYRRALAALEFVTPPTATSERRRCELWLCVGEALNRVADLEGGKQAFVAAADVARSLLCEATGADPSAAGDALLLARAAYGYGGDGNATGSVEALRIALLEEALQAIGPADSRWRARLLARLSIMLAWSRQPLRTRELILAAIGVAERMDDDAALAEALDAFHYSQWARTSPDERMQIATRLLHVAQKHNDRSVLCWARFWRFVDLLEIGDSHQAELELLAHRELALALRDPRQAYFSNFARIALWLLEGRLAEADAALLETATQGEAAQVADTPVVYVAQLLLLRWFQGRISEVEPLLRATVAQVEGIPAAQTALIFVDAQLVRHHSVRQQLARLCADGFDWLPEDVARLPALVMLGEACANVGAVAQAAALVEQLTPHFDHNAVAGFGAASWGPVARVLGRLAALLGREVEMRRSFEHALDLCVRMRAAPWLAQTQFDYATALLAVSGKAGSRQARLLLEQARASAQHLALPALMTQIESLSLQLEESPAAAVPPLVQRTFVGRQVELERLKEALTAARLRRGSITLLAGEAGIGKTELAMEFADVARAELIPVLWGRCREGSSTPPFWVWNEVIRASLVGEGSAAVRAALGEATATLAQIVPQAFDATLRVDPLLGSDAASGRRRLFESVACWLRALCTQGCVVLILEDLHWADVASRELLEFLSAEVSSLPVLIVGSYRETSALSADASEVVLVDLPRRLQAGILTLSGLAASDISDLLGKRLGSTPSAAVVSVVERRTAGNPFFIDEMLRLLSAQELADSTSPEALILSALLMSPGVREVIGRRLLTLSESCRILLRIAAVVGSPFDVQLLHSVLRASTRTPAEPTVSVLGFLRQLEPAVASRLLVAGRDQVGAFSFAHSLIQEVLYAEIPAAERVERHWQIGQALMQNSVGHNDAPIEAIAHHLFEGALAATDRSDAVHFAVAAGERAERRYLYDEAARQFERALELLSVTADRPRRADILHLLGAVRLRAGAITASKLAFAAAADLARELADGPRLAEAALGYVGMMLDTQEVVRERVQILEEALCLLDTSDSALRAKLLGALAMELYYSESAAAAEYRESIALEAVAIARRVGDAKTLVDVLRCYHLAAWGPANLAARLECANEICGLAASSGNPDWLLSGHSTRLMDSLEGGDLGAVEKSLAIYTRVAEHTRRAHPRWRAMVFRTMLAILAGDLEQGEQLAFAAFEAGQPVHPHYAAQYFGAQLFVLRRDQGRLGELLSAVQDLADRNPNVPAWRGALAYIHALSGRNAEAAAELERLAGDAFAGIPRDNSWLGTMASLSMVVHMLSDTNRAAELYELLRPFAEQWVVLGDAAACAGPVAYYLGLLGEVLSQPQTAAQHYRAAVASSTRNRARPARLRAQLAQASMQLRWPAADGTAQAAVALQDVATEAATYGLVPLADEALALLASTASQANESATSKVWLRNHRDHWLITCGEESWTLRDSKGLRILACLLREAGREFHVLDLMQMSASATSTAEFPAATRALAMESGMPILDAAAKASYRRRLQDLRADLEEAEGFNDLGRAASARTEIEAISTQLASAIGLGGRDRVAGSATERARSTVTQRLKEAVRRVTAASPRLGESLQTSIRTGTYCSYAPDPKSSPSWVTE